MFVSLEKNLFVFSNPLSCLQILVFSVLTFYLERYSLLTLSARQGSKILYVDFGRWPLPRITTFFVSQRISRVVFAPCHVIFMISQLFTGYFFLLLFETVTVLFVRLKSSVWVTFVIFNQRDEPKETKSKFPFVLKDNDNNLSQLQQHKFWHFFSSS